MKKQCHGHGRILLLAVCLVALVHQGAHGGGLQDLDAKSRRAVREAQIEQYGSGGRGSAPSEQSDGKGGSAVSVADTMSSTGKKKCVVKVGEVVTNRSLKGARQENITYVDGNVVNVCE